MTREELMRTSNRQKQIVADFLLNYASENNWSAIEDKQLPIDKCWDYIVNEVRKVAVSNCAVVSDEDVFNLAIHFYDESKAAIKLKKEAVEPKKVEPKNKAIRPEQPRKAKGEAEYEQMGFDL